MFLDIRFLGLSLTFRSFVRATIPTASCWAFVYHFDMFLHIILKMCTVIALTIICLYVMEAVSVWMLVSLLLVSSGSFFFMLLAPLMDMTRLAFWMLVSPLYSSGSFFFILFAPLMDMRRLAVSVWILVSPQNNLKDRLLQVQRVW